jgi:hypothetical protein
MAAVLALSGGLISAMASVAYVREVWVGAVRSAL